MQTYTGSCHCGAITFTVTGELTQAIRCNCSHCKRKGFLLAFVPEADFSLQTGADNLTLYQFNTKKIEHRFCKTCGVQCFGRGSDADGNYMIAINLNCLEDFDTTTLTIKDVDGARI